MHVTKFFLRESVSGIASPRVQHGHVLVELFEKIECLGLRSSPVDYRAPRRQNAQLTVPRRLRIRSNHGHPRTYQIRPIFNRFWVSLADDKNNGGCEWLGIVRQSPGPVPGDQPVFAERIYVREQRQRDDIRWYAINNSTRLARRAAMRLLDGQSLAC